MTSPPMRIQNGFTPRPMKIRSPQTKPSTKPDNKTTPSSILLISCCPVPSATGVGREIRHVPEDAEDLLVPQVDVVEKRDDRETAHVRDVLVVLDLREEIVHARWEPRDAHLPDVLRLEGRLLRLEDAPDLPEVRAEGGDDVVVHRKRKAFLDVPLNRVPHDPERLGPLQGHVPAVHPLVDQFPRRVAHRVRETQEVGEVETEAAVLPSEVHR